MSTLPVKNPSVFKPTLKEFKEDEFERNENQTPKSKPTLEIKQKN